MYLTHPTYAAPTLHLAHLNSAPPTSISTHTHYI